MKKFIRYVKTCLKLLAIFCSLAVCVCLTGCMNIVGHVSGGYKPYETTKGCYYSIVEAFVEKPEWHFGSVGEASQAHAWSLLLLPVTVIMLPVEAVADTVTFPYDYLKDRNKEND